QLLLLTLSERKSPIGYHFSLFASQRMLAWQAFERGCLSWIQKFGISFGIARISFGIAGIGFRG
ncbi:MAG: hypothetical protein ACKPGT_23355, partial [Microcystis sp.]